MNEMTTLERIQTGDELERCPFPIPLGWFAVALSEELKPGGIANIHVFGREWVLFRGEDGKAGLADPYCPHLGAHMGHGGEVVGNNLRCPFHHWEYDAEGWCKKIPYAKVMPGIARKKPVLKTLPIEERYGVIFAWYHPNGDEPYFGIPDVPELESDEYIPMRRGEWDIGTMIQEIGENGVDYPHLKYLHHAPIIPPGTAKAEGHIFRTDIGAGYIIGESHGPGVVIQRFTKDGVTMTMFAMSTPIDTEMTKTRMAFTFRNYPEGSKERAIAQHLYEHSIGAADGEDSAGFESVDLIVWDNKKYRPQPLLCDGDGPILLWRKWFSQFYAEPIEA
ncbi:MULTISPECIES: aromatic ring-hydroxylating oxygenase subunit alpha [Sphingomonadales]|uniref:cholesterol 7-desaturase n=2 Tax=Edaphosphingomonas TaxID=3423724 RepID=A0A2T4HR22_9SPHN|nr:MULTISPECIES: Rieske 2Fe-2S domain-containing protein [Sphingomonas]AGH48458.1 Rieske family iron-sulfur cluster-binding protein [Sphingomonas sp. MM-1]MDX3883361.1 Rieske 2Fe-2S domain-containing protein [Sphingomonas sp.]OHT20935.1 3-ketosteroid-9-alpha-monooxygenase oxygenase subunit [Sphingomonas haloaromaticamans]PTD18250.1 Rieske (2Fe-2S) protein [Sphingomonas fennica]